MSKVRANNFTNKAGDGAPTFPHGANVTGVVTATSAIVGSGITINSSGINATGVITATSYQGDGSALTGIDATSLKDSGGNIKVQANTSGAVVTGVLTATSTVVGSGITINSSGINATGVITATTYYGSGANLTGIDATQIQTGNTSVQTFDTGSDGNVKINTEGTERWHITNDGTFLSQNNSNIHLNNGKIIGNPSNHVFIDAGSTVQVYVSDSGNDSTGTGESNSPVRTISRACELLPKVMGNQTFEIRIQGSSYTTTNGGQNIHGFSFNGSNNLSRYLQIMGDTQTVTVNLQNPFEFYNVHGFRLQNLAFNVGSSYAGGISFYSCSEGRIYNTCSFTSSSNYGWSERIAFRNTKRVSWEADCALTAQASSGLGGFVTIGENCQIDWSGDIDKSGTRFGNHAITAYDNSILKLAGCVINNFQNGITGGNNHYNNEAGARIVVNGVTVQNCVTGLYLRNNSHCRKYSITYSSNSTNELITSNSSTD